MLDAETVVGSGTMKVACSREELTQKLAVVSRGVSTLETSNQTFHPGTGWGYGNNAVEGLYVDVD